MLAEVRARLSYANVVATLALFVALGGGTYAAVSGIPDPAGIFHGCVSKRTGVLRVVKSASSCQKARGRGKRRNPGEFAVSWNQKGQQGQKGDTGPATGPAGGDLTGSYPNPSVAPGAITPSKLGRFPAVRTFDSSSSQSAGAGIQIIALPSTDFDTAGAMHSDTVNNSRLIAPVAGIYQAAATVEWSANATGRRLIRINKNDLGPSIATSSVQATSTGNTVQTVSVLVRLAAGDYVDFDASQTSGATLTFTVQSAALNWVGAS